MAYADTDELFRILQIRTPSDDQTAVAERVLETAAGEIDSEIDLAADVTLEPWQLELVTQVNLERAQDLWHLSESNPFGGIEGFSGEVTRPGRYSWERYAQRLAPLKNQWGLA